MRILGIERDDSGSNLYRIYQPLYKMADLDMAKITTIQDGRALGSEKAMTTILESDIIFFSRPASDEWFKFIKVCQKYGKIVVCDYDDDPFNTHVLNPYYQFIGTEEVAYQWSDGTKEMLWSRNPMEHGGRYLDIEQNIRRRDLFKASFKKADMVTCTTDYLCDNFKKINPNSVVLPNLIDFNFWPSVEFVKKEIRIGWQGGASHYEDLWIIKDALKEILKKYSNVKFTFLGDSRFYGLFKDIPTDRVECYGWCKTDVYAYKMTCMNIDIGLCPLIDNEFNKNKSAIKYFEYSMNKSATIASDMLPYSPCITNEKDGLLIKGEDSQAWFDAMERLILDKAKREELGRNAYDNVRENYNAEKGAHLWLDAFEKLMKKDVSEELCPAS